MKYLVSWAWEMDGHAGSSCMVCKSINAVTQYITQSLLDDEGKPMGKITSRHKTEDGYDYYGTWDCGDFAISVVKFKNFTDMCHKEIFSRTG